MDNNNLKEKNFQKYTGWSVPLFIKIAWSALAVWILFYLFNFLVPSLREWLGR